MQLRDLIRALESRPRASHRDKLLLAELIDQQVAMETAMGVTPWVERGGVYLNKLTRPSARARAQFKAVEQFRWPIGRADALDRTDIAVVQRIVAAEAAIPSWLHITAWADMRSAWLGRLRGPVSSHAAGQLLGTMVGHVKANAMTKAWRQCPADPYPRRIRDQTDDKGKAKTGAARRRSVMVCCWHTRAFRGMRYAHI